MRSTTREILVSTLKTRLKGHSNIRWCTRGEAIKALAFNFKEVIDLLNKIQVGDDNNSSSDSNTADSR